MTVGVRARRVSRTAGTGIGAAETGGGWEPQRKRVTAESEGLEEAWAWGWWRPRGGGAEEAWGGGAMAERQDCSDLEEAA